MPSQKTNETLSRRLALLQHLPHHGAGITARELTEILAESGYKVDVRTIQRDLIDLLDVVPIDCNDSGKPYGYRWRPNGINPFVDLSVETALTLKLVEGVLSRLLPASLTSSLAPQFELATHKLEALAQSNVLARWAGKVRHMDSLNPLLPAHIDPDVLQILQECLLHEELLEISYRKPGQESTSRVVRPYGIVQRGTVSYLVAHTHDGGELRTFAIHRIVSAKRCYEKFIPEPDFDLDEIILNGDLFPESEEFKLQLWVDDSLAHILHETPLGKDQILLPASDGEGWTVTATVQSGWALWSWLLGKGTELMVLEPAWLVEDMRKEIEVLSNWYRNTDH